MVYSSHFVVCVLVNGIPQKELANGIVPIQFSKEYGLRFRNKNSRKAVVKFTIDGENVSGNGYIIQANSAIDIHRYADKDAKFKFVELDSPEAIEHGKNGPNSDGTKGVIEAKFYLEKKLPVSVPWPIYQNYYVGNSGWYTDHQEWPNLINPYQSQASINVTTNVAPTNLKDGCTVEGNLSGQWFINQPIDLENDYTTIRCVLKGIKSESVHENVAYCTNCGAKKARVKDNFCGVCGRKFA